jgi:hypothetical protein
VNTKGADSLGVLPFLARHAFVAFERNSLDSIDRGKAISTETAAAIVEAAMNFGQSDDITVVKIERLASGAAPSGK